jgi:hypothetical protein
VKRVTVSQWVKRGEWTRERKAVVEERLESISHTVEDVTARNILRHEEQIQRLVGAKIDSLAKFQPKKSRDFVNVAEGLKKLDDIGRRNLGLNVGDTPSSTPPTSISFNMSLRPLPPRVIDMDGLPIVKIEDKPASA